MLTFVPILIYFVLTSVLLFLIVAFYATNDDINYYSL